MHSYVAVAEAQSFTRAARRIGSSPTAITRDIATLETHLGVRLLQRTTRQVRITAEGSLYLGHAKRILADVAEARSAIQGTHGDLTGPVSVTAPTTFGRLHVTPELLTFAAMHPQITLRTVFLDRVVDLLDEGLDVAVRIAHLPDTSATATRVGSVRRKFCASPAYLAEHGEPKTLTELNDHVAVTTSNTPLPWRVPTREKSTLVNPHSRFVANTVDLAIAAAEAGLGIVWLLSYQLDAAIESGRLQPVLTQHDSAEIPIHVVHLQGRVAPQRTRALVDHLVAGLRNRLADLEPRVGS